MKAIIKKSFDDVDRASNSLLVTPQSFNYVKSWDGIEVSGLDYYVNKAAKLGAIKPKPKRKRLLEQ